MTAITLGLDAILTEKAGRKMPRKWLEEKWKKSLNLKHYSKKLLQNCKSLGGTCRTVEELQQILSEKADQDVYIVKTELPYYRHIHKANKTARPDFLKLNGYFS